MANVPDTKENRSKCVCPKCPSYPQDCQGEVLYCSVGKSRCDIAPKGCICPSCPIYPIYKLDKLYYCNQE